MPKILIVDDEVNLITLVQIRLEANGYEVISAKDGKEGLEKAKSETPDLIILDVMMPEMDGYEVCRSLKNDALYNKIPIILFSGKASGDFQEAGMKAGADACIRKPFEAPVLLGKIKELLSK